VAHPTRPNCEFSLVKPRDPCNVKPHNQCSAKPRNPCSVKQRNPCSVSTPDLHNRKRPVGRNVNLNRAGESNDPVHECEDEISYQPSAIRISNFQLKAEA
jgi:hypothetical protein